MWARTIARSMSEERAMFSPVHYGQKLSSRSHLERPLDMSVSIVHVAHIVVGTREHTAGVAADRALELVEYAIILVQVTQLKHGNR